MITEIFDACIGEYIWKKLCYRKKITHNEMVLVLTMENEEVDRIALQYLDMLIDRRNLNRAIIIVPKNCVDLTQSINYKYPIVIVRMNQRNIFRLYKRYCLDKFYVNIYWTYISKTKNNLLGRFISETQIDVRDIVCLSIYKFREIPSKIVKV